MVRVPVCHTGGRGFESRQPRSPREGAVAQFGRALESHSRGRGFESRRLHFCHRSSEVEHSIRNRAVVGSIPTGGLVRIESSDMRAWRVLNVAARRERCFADSARLMERNTQA